MPASTRRARARRRATHRRPRRRAVTVAPSAGRRIDLGDRRALGHEHLAGHPQRARRVGDRLRVVAGAAAHDAARAAVAERGDLRDRATELERAGALKVLGLQRDHRRRPARKASASSPPASPARPRRPPARPARSRRAIDELCGRIGRDQSGSATTASISTCAPRRQRGDRVCDPRRRAVLEERARTPR